MNDAADMFAPLPSGPQRSTTAGSEGATKAPDWKPELPAPEEPPAVPRHPARGTPAATWIYRDAEGRPLFMVARFNPPGRRKEIVPYSYGTKDGRRGWHWQGPPSPSALYRLPDLAARPAAPVLVVEGEKAAEAAAVLFPSHCVATWQGGAQAVERADWKPLAGRAVAVWPDNDKPGADAAADVVKALGATGAASVAVVKIPAGWPDKWDVADALPDGVTADALRAMLAEAERAATEEAAAAAALPPGFRLTPDGLFFVPPGDDDAQPAQVCGPLRVVAATNDGAGRAWGALLEWKDGDGRRHQWAMPRAMLAGDGTEVRAHLLDAGLFLAPGRKARERLAEYLTRADPPGRVRVVARLGWHGTPGARCFVLPDGALGSADAGRVMLQTERPDALPPLVQAGSLADWQRDVAALAVGNTRLAFAICTALAAPLLALVNGEGGGFHLRGPSSVGKSTALLAAGSVWGGGGLRGWVRSWRTTDNALEAVAAAHCDLLLALDEMGEAPAETVAACAYALANGAGKGRATRDGSARRIAEWRVLFLSTGEEGLADRLAEARGGPKRVRAGQEVRVLDVPADTGAHGLFETLHDHATAAALADAIKAAAGRYYGTAGRAWLEILAADPEGIAAQAREVVDAFIAAHVPPDAAGQVRRAVARFGLVAAAGELAAGLGVLPWQPGEAERAAAACFMAWRRNRAAGDGAAEDAAAVAAVRAFVAAHGSARFQVVGETETTDEARPVINRAGWRKRDADGWRYLIQLDTWKREVVAGMDPEAAARALRVAGFLVPQSETAERHSRMERVGEPKPFRVYVVRDSILSGASKADAEAEE
ncbi:DUF927 domain-containing protein [Roseomonas sp. PWR1]|uniref:DUF927 domain-containing protein n=1 Tax=Roseomonas nitratireducens TaxID=2820810 RepID=A0ABS4AXV6_9PROT|nr:DUF927 domain-containing protein [Neoroseomonas nitratireducens]MBP0466209.1 DUF927 domain-containing protein [Neoroseomonas nitratireducens]